MSVLKKLGSILATVGADITKFLGFPFISQLLGLIPGAGGAIARTVLGDLGTIAGIITNVEAAYQSTDGQKLGSQKLTAAAPQIQKVILLWAQSNLPGHSKIVTSPDLFAQHCKALTSDFADVMNDFGD